LPKAIGIVVAAAFAAEVAGFSIPNRTRRSDLYKGSAAVALRRTGEIHRTNDGVLQGVRSNFASVAATGLRHKPDCGMFWTGSDALVA
jgi:hypothetical protein